jgi:hypothetical protein
MPKYRVYQYYVGCRVYNVDANTPEDACEKIERFGNYGPGIDFLHEANDPSENVFAHEVFRYEDGEHYASDEPVLSKNDVCCDGMLEIWKGLKPPELERLIKACQEVSRMAPKPEVPELEDMPDLDPDQYESLAYDAGLYHAAEKVRAALREIGVKPEEGTTEWYHEEPADA